MTMLIGHSHMDCAIAAAKTLGVTVGSQHLWGYPDPILYDGDVPRLNPALDEVLEAEVVSMVGGAAHDLLGLIQHPSPFDFVLPDEPDIPLLDGARILPYQAVESLLRKEIADVEYLLPGLIAATGRTVVHVESPPPYADNAVLKDQVGLMIVLWNRPPEAGDSPSSPWLRYKLWRTHSAIVRESSESRGVPFVAAPRESLIDGRFLRPDLHGYPCHANEGYGELLLRQLGLLK